MHWLGTLKNPRVSVPLATVVVAVGVLIFWQLVWPAFRTVEGNEALPFVTTNTQPSTEINVGVTDSQSGVSQPTFEPASIPPVPPDQPATGTTDGAPPAPEPPVGMPPPDADEQRAPITEALTHPASDLIQGDAFHYLNSGRARFLEQGEQRWVRIEDLDMTDGPDVHVYLATDLNSITGDFVDLGQRKGNFGSFNYEIPAGTDLAKYRFVVHWCVPFRVLFNHAELQLAS